MRLLNRILAYESNNFIIVKIQKKLRKIFKIYFVPTNLKDLPKNNYSINSNFHYQEELIKKFSKTNELTSFNTFPKMTEMLKMLFLQEDSKFNFLDFGGENIDFYLHLKKKFKNVNYFIFNKRKINEDFIKLKKKYNFNNITILENLDEIYNNKYEFINFGSVIQYVENYEEVLLKIINVSKKYIFFSATHFSSEIINQRNSVIVRQVNLLPNQFYCYFFNFDNFAKIFLSKKFSIVFKEKNKLDNVNYNNFESSFGNIIYTDLLLSL